MRLIKASSKLVLAVRGQDNFLPANEYGDSYGYGDRDGDGYGGGNGAGEGYRNGSGYGYGDGVPRDEFLFGEYQDGDRDGEKQ